jgi:hypothetical protein
MWLRYDTGVEWAEGHGQEVLLMYSSRIFDARGNARGIGSYLVFIAGKHRVVQGNIHWSLVLRSDYGVAAVKSGPV